MSDLIRSRTVHCAHNELAGRGASAITIEGIADRLALPLGDVVAHFPTTQALLTALIIEAYDASAAAMEAADPGEDREPGVRLLAVTRALRDWAAEHPAQFSLIYGSPVPGYDAPPETVPPASRTPAVLARIVHAALVAGVLRAPSRKLLSQPLVRPEAVVLFGQLPPEPYADLLERGIVLWSSVLGLVSFAVLGRTHDSVRDQASFFDFGVAVAAEAVGLDVPPAG